jgi:hypothetical protein
LLNVVDVNSVLKLSRRSIFMLLLFFRVSFGFSYELNFLSLGLLSLTL